MKITLQDAVRAIHGAEGTDVKNLIPTAGIGSRTRAFFDKLALVAGQQKNLFTALNRIFCAGDLLKQRLCFIYHAERNVETRHNMLHHREIDNIFMNKEL